MGHWGIKSYEHDEAAEALDVGFDRVHGHQYEELMDDRNPLSYEQVQQKLADSRTLDAAIEALCEMLGTERPAETWDELGDWRSLESWSGTPSSECLYRNRGGSGRSTGFGTKRSNGRKRLYASCAGAKRSTYWSERQGRHPPTQDMRRRYLRSRRRTNNGQRTTNNGQPANLTTRPPANY